MFKESLGTPRFDEQEVKQHYSAELRHRCLKRKLNEYVDLNCRSKYCTTYRIDTAMPLSSRNMNYKEIMSIDIPPYMCECWNRDII